MGTKFSRPSWTLNCFDRNKPSIDESFRLANSMTEKNPFCVICWAFEGKICQEIQGRLAIVPLKILKEAEKLINKGNNQQKGHSWNYKSICCRWQANWNESSNHAKERNLSRNTRKGCEKVVRRRRRKSTKSNLRKIHFRSKKLFNPRLFCRCRRRMTFKYFQSFESPRRQSDWCAFASRVEWKIRREISFVAFNSVHRQPHADCWISLIKRLSWQPAFVFMWRVIRRAFANWKSHQNFLVINSC